MKENNMYSLMLLIGCITLCVLVLIAKGCDVDTTALRNGYIQKEITKGKIIWVKPCPPADNAQDTSSNTPKISIGKNN